MAEISALFCIFAFFISTSMNFFRNHILFTAFNLFVCFSFAQIPNGYYDSTTGLSGSNLKEALYNIIKNPNVVPYNNIWDYFSQTDQTSTGKVWDMYSNCTFNFVTNQCGNYSAECDCYNREHSFPKSWFNDASPMYSDMFHIYPTDGYVNGQRSNLPYGEVGSASYTSSNGCKKGSNSFSGYSGTVFEPIDTYKGDLARTYFYMVTCYHNLVASWQTNDPGADAMLNGTAYPAFESWAVQMLMNWHELDPVSQKEIDRNNAIYTIQGNRNPFIDHPEFVCLTWGTNCSNYSESQVLNSKTMHIYNIESELHIEGYVELNNPIKIQIFNEFGTCILKKKFETITKDWTYSISLPPTTKNTIIFVSIFYNNYTFGKKIALLY